MTEKTKNYLPLAGGGFLGIIGVSLLRRFFNSLKEGSTENNFVTTLVKPVVESVSSMNNFFTYLILFIICFLIGFIITKFLLMFAN